MQSGIEGRKARRSPDTLEPALSLCGKEAKRSKTSGRKGGEGTGERDQTPRQPCTLCPFPASRQVEDSVPYLQACLPVSLLTGVRNGDHLWGCLVPSLPNSSMKKAARQFRLDSGLLWLCHQSQSGSTLTPGGARWPLEGTRRPGKGCAVEPGWASWPHSSNEN